MGRGGRAAQEREEQQVDGIGHFSLDHPIAIGIAGRQAGRRDEAQKIEAEQVDRIGVILEGTPQLTIGTITVGAHA